MSESECGRGELVDESRVLNGISDYCTSIDICGRSISLITVGFSVIVCGCFRSLNIADYGRPNNLINANEDQ